MCRMMYFIWTPERGKETLRVTFHEANTLYVNGHTAANPKPVSKVKARTRAKERKGQMLRGCFHLLYS